MSHMTKMDTTVKLVNTQALIDALTCLQGMYKGLTFTQTNEVIRVNYKPLQGYHSQNLHLVKEINKWTVNGDAYQCKEVYTEIVNQVQVFYQASLTKMYTSRNKYTNVVQESKAGLLKMRARSY